MDKVLKKAAEILVECGYAYKIKYANSKGKFDSPLIYVKSETPTMLNCGQFSDPFADTLEGRRQADAIEDWLYKHEFILWDHKSLGVPENHGQASEHLQRVDRIKWCLEQLA